MRIVQTSPKVGNPDDLWAQASVYMCRLRVKSASQDRRSESLCDAAAPRCSLSEGGTRPSKELGLKAPLRAITVIACVRVSNASASLYLNPYTTSNLLHGSRGGRKSNRGFLFKHLFNRGAVGVGHLHDWWRDVVFVVLYRHREMMLGVQRERAL